MTAATEVYASVDEAMGGQIIGMPEVRRFLVVALLMRGHVLLEGAPGLGKTLLAKTFARAIGGAFQRVQGTADLLPSDVTGQAVFDPRTAEFSFRAGPVFTDVLLVDEINRASPKTQSALLEAMAERQVTVDRESRALPQDFLVIATQNPGEFEGTYPLPESELDRFMVALDVWHPEREVERAVLERHELVDTGAPADGASLAAVPPSLVAEARAQLRMIHLSTALQDYLLDLIHATRVHPAVETGASTRGLLTLARTARGLAAIRGSDYVSPDDVRAAAVPVLAHRLSLRPESSLEGRSERDVVEEILAATAVPR